MHKIKKAYKAFLFIIKNIHHFSRSKNISKIIVNDRVIIDGTSRKQLNAVLAIYSNFNKFSLFTIIISIIYFFCSRKVCFFVKDVAKNKIIGCELYYLNERDIVENTVHQGFRGILREWQGKGIGTMLTSHAISHFRECGFDGISSRVSLNNIPSLKSNMNLGFKPVEKYFDKKMKEEQYYLVRPFVANHKWNFIEMDC